MHLYIANGMHQNIDFQYRLPEYRSYRQQMISIGGQIKISGDLSPQDIQTIVQHHSIYGMVAAKDIHNYKGFLIPYVYSVDEPVPAEIISLLITQNREYNQDLGVRQRMEAALSVNNQIEDQLPDHLKNFEVTIEEVSSKDRDATVNEGIRITRDPERGAPQTPDKNLVNFNKSKKNARR